ncbi:MAG TPA: ATP synthase F1 subunit delta [Chthonomonadaceae bacterium]|nr:ATP synthase F1 subunit delta [Chthonomonadaceae bacterium]
MTAVDVRAASRYAMALFDIAQKQGKLEAIERDLNAVIDLMRLTPVLQKVWESPLLPPDRKNRILGDVLGESFDPLTLTFLRLLVDKQRESILEGVQREVRRLADAARHLVRAEAIFAVAPTTEEKAALIRSLEERTGESVDLTVHVDPAILGGVVVRMQDTLIDGSVRGTLERLREQLLQEA